MDHLDADRTKAVERYVLGDLSVSEVEEFERHFFDCPQCSEELRALAILQETARVVFSEEGSTRPVAAGAPAREPAPVHEPMATRARWWNIRIFVPALAMLAVAAFLGFEAGERRFGSAPQTVAEFPLYAAARGEETVIAPPAGARFYTLFLDKTWDRDYPSYRAAFVSAGSEKFSMPLAAPAPGQAIHILVPDQALSSGRYVLVISGDGTEVARYPFTLRIE
jgi:hypothetical protein